MKVIKFASDLVPLILNGKKTSTWRLFDDKDLQEGEVVEFWNKQTMEKFADAKLIRVIEKTLATLTPEDHEGHNPYANDEEMYRDLQRYYTQRIDSETPVKVIRFILLQ